MKKNAHPIAAVLILLSLAPQPARGQHVPENVPGTSRIEGRILDARGREIAGARVLASHVSSGEVFASPPSRDNGKYLVAGLPYGYYDLAVETPAGLFVAERVINLAPAGTAELLLTLVLFDPSTAALARRHAGSGSDPTGLARMEEKPKGREFWRSPKGVAILGGLGGVALLALAFGADSEDPATSF